MWSSQAYIGRSSRLFKCGVLKHALEGLLACLNVEFSSMHWKVGKCLLKHTLEGLLACLNVEFSSMWKCGVLKHILEGLLACLNVEFSSMHWKVFSLV